MTNQEAIKILKNTAFLAYQPEPIEVIEEAVDMAISALQVQEVKTQLSREDTTSDLISRQAAIDAINTWDKFGVDERSRIIRWHEGLEPYVHLRDVLTAIVNLPPAQPEIVRCKDCDHRDPEDKKCDCGHAILWQLPRQDDWYCADAERRTDEGD